MFTTLCYTTLWTSLLPLFIRHSSCTQLCVHQILFIAFLAASSTWWPIFSIVVRCRSTSLATCSSSRRFPQISGYHSSSVGSKKLESLCWSAQVAKTPIKFTNPLHLQKSNEPQERSNNSWGSLNYGTPLETGDALLMVYYSSASSSTILWNSARIWSLLLPLYWSVAS